MGVGWIHEPCLSRVAPTLPPQVQWASYRTLSPLQRCSEGIGVIEGDGGSIPPQRTCNAALVMLDAVFVGSHAAISHAAISHAAISHTAISRTAISCAGISCAAIFFAAISCTLLPPPTIMCLVRCASHHHVRSAIDGTVGHTMHS